MTGGGMRLPRREYSPRNDEGFVYACVNLDYKWGVDEFEFAEDWSEEYEYKRTFYKVYGEGKEKGEKEI